MAEWKMQIASSPEREKVFVEMWYKGELWGEISQEGERPILEIYPSRHMDPWRLDLLSTLEMLEAAWKHLQGDI